jgi:para-nitrobenzyl esterase
MTWRAMLSEPTPEHYKNLLEILYPQRASEALKAYPATTRDEIIQAATDMSGDRFIAYSTWKWVELHSKTSGARVYRYLYTRPRPSPRGQNTPPARGAVHSAEIEYALGNLAVNDVYAWTEDDYRVSATMQNYFANFIKKADPNGPGLPQWPVIPKVMRLDVQSRAEPDTTRARYLFLDQFLSHR